MNKENFILEIKLKKHISKQLTILLKQYKLNRHSFAKIFGFNKKSVNNWLNCNNLIKLKHLMDICDYFKLKISYFLPTDL